jgi:CelD/BcsL family acetyltransferase involved in cellulose biosynthesis
VVNTLRCEVIATAEELLALQRQWNSLLGNFESGGVFLSNEWFDAAWEWAREDASLYIVCVWEGSHLKGVAPFCKRRRVHYRIPLRTLEFIAIPDTPYCDLICLSGDADVVVAALFAHLQSVRNEWDMIELARLPPSSVAQRLSSTFDASGFRCEPCIEDTDFQVNLRSTWTAYYATRSRRLKKGNNLIANHLKKDFRAVEIAAQPSADVDAAKVLETLVAVSASSWKTETSNSLNDAGPRRFIAKLTQHAAARGWLRVFVLSLDGRPAATEYQILDGQTIRALRADCDQQFDRHSPGTYLSWRILEQAFDGRYACYSMGAGANPYKLRWNDQLQTIEGARILRRTPRALAVHFLEYRLRPVASRLRARLRAKSGAMSTPTKQESDHAENQAKE